MAVDESDLARVRHLAWGDDRETSPWRRRLRSTSTIETEPIDAASKGPVNRPVSQRVPVVTSSGEQEDGKQDDDQRGEIRSGRFRDRGAGTQGRGYREDGHGTEKAHDRPEDARVVLCPDRRSVERIVEREQIDPRRRPTASRGARATRSRTLARSGEYPAPVPRARRWRRATAPSPTTAGSARRRASLPAAGAMHRRGSGRSLGPWWSRRSYDRP